MTNLHNPCIVQKINLSNTQSAATYQKLLNAYALDPMGGGKAISDQRLQKVCDDLSAMPHALVYLAYMGKEAVGFATCFMAYSTFSAKPLTNIHDIAVISEQRNKGIARALLQKIARDAAEKGHCKITLEVREDNLAADTLYRSEGFTTADFHGLAVQYLFLEKEL